MANIQPYVDDIRNARYGRDVRESIAAGIEAMNAESSGAYDAAITAQDSATASAQAASTSANNAQASATQAANSATSAQNTVNTVNSYRADAKTYRDEASSFANRAQASATNAATSEANALSSANNAQTAATGASGSATQASNSATTAVDAMRNATASATQAASSAVQASSSQTAAATSATNAKTSENAARQYAEQAQQIVGIGVMTNTKNGIGRPDGTTITVNEFGVFSAQGIADHVDATLGSNDGVHGTRIQNGKLQTWDEATSSWVDAISMDIATADKVGVVKPDGTTITVDVDGTIHGVSVGSATKTKEGLVKIIKNASDLESLASATANTTVEAFLIKQKLAEGGASSEIRVHTSTEEFIAQTVTATITDADGVVDTVTGTFDSNGLCVLKVKRVGTYSVTVSVAGDSYSASVNIPYFGIYRVNLNESMHGLSAWLTAGGLSPASYSDVASVLADEVAVRRLMTIHASCDEFVEWYNADNSMFNQFASNRVAMKWIGLRDYICDKLMAIPNIWAQMMASEHWEYILKDKVPVMTSNTAPYGEAFASSENTTSNKAYHGCDGDINTMWTSSGSATDVRNYIGYKFVNPICVKKAKYVASRDVNTAPDVSIKVQASNDNSTWTDLTDVVVCDNSNYAETEIDINNESYYLYYRLYFVTNGTRPPYYTSYHSHAREFQFYGRSLNESVPVMTSNAEPMGEVIADSYVSGYLPYMAFDNVSGNWESKEAGDYWLGYKFGRPICVKAFNFTSVWWSNLWYWGNYEVQASNDDFATYETLYEETRFTSQGQNYGAQSLALDNNKAFSAYRLFLPYNKRLFSGQGGAITKINFYGVSYSEEEFGDDGIEMLYDNGVEIQPIEEVKTSTNIADKRADSLYAYMANGGNTDANFANFRTPRIDISPYKVVCATLQTVSDASLAIRNEDSFSWTGNVARVDAVAPLVERNAYLNCSNVNGNYYVTVGVGYATGRFIEVSKMWLQK